MMKNGLMIFLFAYSSLLFAQTWRPLPMYGGGFITDLVLHPSDANTIVGVCDVGGLFISTDDCQTWASHTAKVPKTDARNFQVRSFAFDPIAPNTQYFISGDSPYSSVSKIWKTTNNAAVWNYTSLPINISGNDAAVLYVDWGATDGANIEIINQFGQQMNGCKLLENKHEINLLCLPNGVYFLKVGEQMIRFVKI